MMIRRGSNADGCADVLLLSCSHVSDGRKPGLSKFIRDPVPGLPRHLPGTGSRSADGSVTFSYYPQKIKQTILFVKWYFKQS